LHAGVVVSGRGPGSKRTGTWLTASGQNPRRPTSGFSEQFNPGRNCMDILRLIAAILLPPLGVFLQVGFGGAFWLNILLTLFGYLPGIIHAVWIIARR